MADEIKPKKTETKKDAKAPAEKSGKTVLEKGAGKLGEVSKTAAVAPVGPVAASAPTAAELLGDDPNAKKIVKAKGSKNVRYSYCDIL